MSSIQLSVTNSQLPKEYKQTEIGVMPDDWNSTSISQISEPVRGGSPRPAGSPKYFNGEFIPWLTVAALTNIPPSQTYVTETASFLTEEGSLYSRTLNEGTLIIANSGAIIIANSGATLGVAKILGIKCCANDGIAALLKLHECVIPLYLTYYINSKTTYLRDVVAIGNGQPNLNTALIGNIKFPLPPSKLEQEAIAQALSDTDALIESLEQLIAKKRLIKQGAMQELLTGKRRSPGFDKGQGHKKTELGIIPEDWQCVPAGEVIRFLGGNGFSSRAETLFGVRWLKIANVGINEIKWNVQSFLPEHYISDYKDYVLKAGDVVIALTRPILNDKLKISKLEKKDAPALLNQRVAQLIPKRNNDLNFLFYLVQRSNFVEAMTIAMAGSDPPNIGNAALEKIVVIVPNSEQEQKAIATILSDMDTEISALEEKLAKTRKIKQGMMHELLTGRIRLLESTP